MLKNYLSIKWFWSVDKDPLPTLYIGTYINFRFDFYIFKLKIENALSFIFYTQTNFF